MTFLTRLAAGLAAGALAGATAAAGLAAAAPAHPWGSAAVFVQTDNLSGNEVVAYHRAADGQLTEAAVYPTGGLGGQLAGSVVDHLASQGSLALDPTHHLLFAVNAGSDTVSVFSVAGDALRLREVVGSGGEFPVSVAVYHGLVYVLDGLGGGSVQGYAELGDHLVALPWAHRSLGLDPNATPQYTNTPGQVAFAPNGSQLIVTTKANGDDIDVFGIGAFGALSAPVVNAEPGTVPFAVTFGPGGELVVVDAGTNAVTSFLLGRNGTLTPLASTATGQSTACWVVSADGYLYVSNAGSSTLSTLRSGPDGRLSLVATTGTDPGTVDPAVTPDGRFLYVQTGASGVVDEFRIGAGGSLTRIGSVTVPSAVGGEGIVAS